jgi:SAM-dependent methyltransferase
MGHRHHPAFMNSVSRPNGPTQAKSGFEWGTVSVVGAARRYWAGEASRRGRLTATRALFAAFWEFARNSTPARLRQRYGDADYDWEHRVNTTSGAVGWRDRLLGVLNSPYQPTEPGLFQEMMEALARQAGFDFGRFTFLDLGSGKGRTLLMASDYPFRRIVGVELLASLHAIAEENLGQYKNDAQRCFALESICADATEFALPEGPLVVYLFNPFPESGLRRVVENLEQRVGEHPRAVYVLYHNPLLGHVLEGSSVLRKVSGTHQYSIFGAGLTAG